MTDARSAAREHALSLLYEAETKGCPASEVLSAQIVDPEPDTVLLVDGVSRHSTRIDELIAERASGWSLDRMATLDLIVLRIATFELLHRTEVPTAVVLNEAVELAKRFGTDDSGRFVNGVLATMARDVR
ncbi:MAG: transcription antitermination factor NusB [Acidimicrobiales bacterium mtb01]|nr:transcription antitermination factor NusB [Actinomycetota bacterium]TEX45230.1 MAG: transcription antitermination factor NusB [Acidimicrobiales bacterium mtb01]